MNLKKERENKLNIYLQNIWDQKLKSSKSRSVNNTVINSNLGWLRPELDYISEYAAEIGYVDLGAKGEVFLTHKGIQRVIQLNSPPEEPLAEPKFEVEVPEIVEEVEKPKQKWYKKLFKKVLKVDR